MKALLTTMAISGVLFALARQNFYTVAKSDSPHSSTCKDFIDNKPDALWVDLHDCRLDMLNGVWFSVGKSAILEIYIPVVPKDADPNETVSLVLNTKSDVF